MDTKLSCEVLQCRVYTWKQNFKTKVEEIVQIAPVVVVSKHDVRYRESINLARTPLSPLLRLFYRFKMQTAAPFPPGVILCFDMFLLSGKPWHRVRIFINCGRRTLYSQISPLVVTCYRCYSHCKKEFWKISVPTSFKEWLTTIIWREETPWWKPQIITRLWWKGNMG